MAQQIKSRKRVAEHGEVYTNEREVNAMLDLVKGECEKIDSTFLEPACGNGNFLVEILRRKLAAVSRESQEKWEKESVRAVKSIYGVDILPDNIEESRERMYKIWEAEYRTQFGFACQQRVCEEVKEVLRQNIICGDFLTGVRDDGGRLVFWEWEW